MDAQDDVFAEVHLPRRALSRMTSKPFRQLLSLSLVPARDRASFALNAMIESDRVVRCRHARSGRTRRRTAERRRRSAALSGVPYRAVESNYGGGGDAVRFVRVGTLDDPDRLPPDIHIFTASKQPWVVLPAGITRGRRIL